MILKTETLREKGLTQEQIDFVMAEVGKEVNAITAERDGYKAQLDTAQASLKAMEGIDTAGLQTKIGELTTQLSGKDAEIEQIKADWAAFKGRAQELDLPSAPKQFLHYFEEDNRPQAKLDRELEGGMAISLGRLRPDTQYDYKFVGLSHNTLRGAAGGAVLLAELLCAEGYIDRK